MQQSQKNDGQPSQNLAEPVIGFEEGWYEAPARVPRALLARARLHRGAHPVTWVFRRDLWVRRVVADRWVAALRIVVSGGRLRVGEVRLYPHEPGTGGTIRDWWSADLFGCHAETPRQGLTKRILRQVPLHDWAAYARAVVASHRTAAWVREFGLATLIPRETARRRGRPTLPAAWYAEVARAYVAAVARGESPIQALARRFRVPLARVRGWVFRARRYGLLTPASQGAGGGALTPRARAVLAAAARGRARQPQRRRRQSHG